MCPLRGHALKIIRPWRVMRATWPNIIIRDYDIISLGILYLAHVSSLRALAEIKCHGVEDVIWQIISYTAFMI